MHQQADTRLCAKCNTVTHFSGQSLFGDDFERVYHRDVAEPPGDGQGAVPILEEEEKQWWICKEGNPFYVLSTEI